MLVLTLVVSSIVISNVHVRKGSLKCRFSGAILSQELIARCLQLPHIPIRAFSQTDLFLVWIYLKLRSPQEPQWPIAITSTALMLTCRHHVDMFTWGRIVLSLLKRAHVDWNWPISREKISKNRLVCKNAVALAYYGTCRLLIMGSWLSANLFLIQLAFCSSVGFQLGLKCFFIGSHTL